MGGSWKLEKKKQGQRDDVSHSVCLRCGVLLVSLFWSGAEVLSWSAVGLVALFVFVLIGTEVLS